jgi:hypothetical protein
MRNTEVFKKHLREKRAVKIISGINNFDLKIVENVARAAQAGLASAIDVACSESVIKVAKQHAKIAIFASGTNPFDLLNAVKWGVDGVEIGNFEALYKEGIKLNADEVYEITLETMNLVSEYDVLVSVTVPGNISIQEQINLAKKLELLGVDVIQTEGTPTTGARNTLELAKTSIANTMELARNVNVPIMTASGLTPQTVPLAFAAGASAVGVGSCVNKLDTQVGMIATIRSIVGSTAYRREATLDLAMADELRI